MSGEVEGSSYYLNVLDSVFRHVALYDVSSRFVSAVLAHNDREPLLVGIVSTLKKKILKVLKKKK